MYVCMCILIENSFPFRRLAFSWLSYLSIPSTLVQRKRQNTREICLPMCSPLPSLPRTILSISYCFDTMCSLPCYMREEVEEMKSVNMMLVCCGTMEIEMLTCFNIYLRRLCNFFPFFLFAFSFFFIHKENVAKKLFQNNNKHNQTKYTRKYLYIYL